MEDDMVRLHLDSGVGVPLMRGGEGFFEALPELFEFLNVGPEERMEHLVR